MENFKESGKFTKQAHVKIPEGHFEEEHGRKGFFGRVSHLYHAQQPTGWTHIEGELKPHNLPPVFDDKKLANKFVKILFNQDVQLYLGTLTENPKTFFRNADCDEMYFIHDGTGQIETSYGAIPYKKGDYIIIPRGTTYKTYLTTPTKFLKVESNSEFEQPTRGILGPNALYDQTAIFTPELLNALVCQLELCQLELGKIESDAALPSTLRFLAVGGASVSPHLLKRAQALSIPVYEGYGLSESSRQALLHAAGVKR